MRTALLFLLMTGVAFAEGGHGDGGFPASKIGFHALNLAFLLGIIYYFAGGKIRDALGNRAVTVKREVEDAAKARQDAQARYEELEARLDGFEKELGTMRAEAEGQVAREVQVIEERSKRDAQLIKESATRTIRDETERARQALRKDAVELAIGLARKQVERNISDADQDRFATEFLDTVGAQQGEVNHG